MTDYTIIGTPKCGSSSLYYYLEKNYPSSKIRKFESFYSKNSREEFDKEYKDSEPIIIIRKQADRLWSGFMTLEMYNRVNFREWLFGSFPAYDRFGFAEPLKQCNWTPYIEPFKNLRPQIYKLEDMIENPNFVKFNDRKLQKNISKSDREFVNSKLKDMKLDEYGFPIGDA